MKAISLWQPWASLIAIGAKRIETRSWPTSYRGPLAIHAAKHTSKDLEWFCRHSAVREAIGNIQYRDLPLGAIVAVCRLVDCIETDEANPLGNERLFGDYGHGRFAWILDNIEAIEPVPYRGRQGLFEVEDSIVGLVAV
jgi:activating signal cointegrator 1